MPSLSLSSRKSLSSAFSVAFRPSRRFSKPLVVIIKASGSLDAKPTVLVAKKLDEAGLKLLKEFANVDCSYNLSLEELCTKISLYD